MEIQTIGSASMWLGFIIFVLAMLALDLGVFHKEAKAVSIRDALAWTLVWISLALLFNVGIYFVFGGEPAIEFLTGYLLEKSLSVDNIFVFVVIFSSFAIPAAYQHRILFWGILGALVLRAAMIFAGTAMLARFHWLMYVFGGFLVLTGIKLFLHRKDEEDPNNSWVLKTAHKYLPSTKNFDGDKFFIIENGKRVATPLFIALLLIEVSDLLFAVDSIPAIFAVTNDPFIVFTSNIFAILGLRSLFFLVAELVNKFMYLKVGLSVVLVFVGIKMLIIDIYKIPSFISLGVIVLLLGGSIFASIIKSKRLEKEAPIPMKRPNTFPGEDK